MKKSIKFNPIGIRNEAVQPYSLKIDDRSISDLLHVFSEYAKQIPFYDEDGINRGNWGEIYNEQILYLWIDILKLDIDKYDRDKILILDHWSLNGRTKAVALLNDILNTLKLLFKKATNVNAFWIISEIEAAIGDSLYRDIDNLVSVVTEKIKEEGKPFKVGSNPQKRFKRIAQIQEAKETSGFVNVLNDHFWLHKLVDTNNYKSLSYTPTKEDNIKDLYTDAINTAINCLVTIKNKLSDGAFDKMLKSGKHSPHIGLLFGFLKSFTSVQNQINELPQRHLDYYYKSILKQQLQSVKPDLALLFIKLKNTYKETSIEKATEFKAGIDSNGDDVIFESTQKFNLSTARISEIKTLLFNKNKTIIPLYDANMVSGIYTKTINAKTYSNIDKNNHEWSMFGTSLLSEGDVILPEIGWALGAPIFQLSSGDRSIKIEFKIHNESAKILKNFLDKDMFKSDYGLLDRFFNNAFELQITSSKGWLVIDEYISSFITDEDQSMLVRFQFSLTKDKPEWVPNIKALHGEKFDSEQALLAIRLKQETVYNPYSFLSLIVIEDVNISVDILNFENVKVFNKHGLVNTTSPFAVFGVDPLKGNTFSLGSIEWINKKVTCLDLVLEWLDLPETGFQEYYKNYTSEKLTNESFQISYRDDITDIDLGSLFIEDKDANLSSISAFKNLRVTKTANFQSSLIKPDLVTPKRFSDAFVSFKLTAPTIGFGSEVYLFEMASYGQRIIKNRKKNEMLLPPQKPFVPKVKSMRVNYQATQRINFERQSTYTQNENFDFFHIHPFGIIKAANQNKILTNQLLPKYKSKGFLYLGLEDAIPGMELSFFLKLIPTRAKAKSKPVIHYLAGDYWRKLSAENIIKNSTNAFQESGVVRLVLPSDLNSNHQLFDVNKNWIRISVNSKHISAFGKCIYLNTNVVEVKRKLNDNSLVFNYVPPMVISSPVKKHAAIDKLEQPMRSYYGRSMETKDEFYTRVSKRLGHKNRIVRENDYIDMIIENFTEVSWIRVLTPSRYPKSIAPGKVKLIVMPEVNNHDDFSNYFISKQSLKQIKKFVIKHCAPRLKIEIEPPHYEIVKVRSCLKTKRINAANFKEEISDIIKKKIAPWLFDIESKMRQDISFSVSNLINAISMHPNVDEVFTCQVIVISSGLLEPVKEKKYGYKYFDSVTDGEIIAPSNEEAVLIPSRDFEIQQVSKNALVEEKLSLKTMGIGEEFILRDSSTDDGDNGVILKQPATESHFLNFNM